MFKYILQIFILLLLCNIASAQQKYTINGVVTDISTGEHLVGANIYFKELMKGTTTNQYGFYSLTFNSGKYNLIVKYLGYTDLDTLIDLNHNMKFNISLKNRVLITDEVIVTGEREDKNIKSTEMGTVQLPIEKIKSLPAVFGEIDILKTIQLLPGVLTAGEGNSGFYVRGGGPDQNLILLDEAVVYNPSHLFGFFSVFNSDAVKDVNLIKAGMPSEYGGRLASVLDISMKDGNNKTYCADGGIGLISSRLTLQGPIIKDKSSFIVSGRRTYFDVLMKPFVNKNSSFKGSSYYFYDLNAKINYKISDKDRIFLSGYFGNDVFAINDKEVDFNNNISWGNATGVARWNHLFSDKLFLNTSLIYNDYKFQMTSTQNSYDFKMFSGINDYNAKLDFSYYPSVKHSIKFGAVYTYHIFSPNNISAETNGTKLDFGAKVKLYSNDIAVYAGDDYDVFGWLKVNYGLRYTCFQQIGPFTRYLEDNLGNIKDSIIFGKNQNVKTYRHLEPRFSLRFTTSKNSSVKASYTQNYQYIHLANVTSVSLPTDLWVPSSDIVQPQIGKQYSLGYYYNFFNNVYETSIEGYYKDFNNQIEYKEGATPEDNIKNNTDNSFTFGKGWSYGCELFIKKSSGKFNGWVGYTLSWTKRKFADLNLGEEFYAKYDRRHDVSVVLIYDYSKKWTFSAVWVYATGNASTLPLARYIIEGNIINEYGARNSFRMSPYHRLDLSITYKPNKKKKVHSEWNLSIYNVYNRYNPYYIYFQTKGSITDMHLETTARQVSLFPIIPSITWNFNF